MFANVKRRARDRSGNEMLHFKEALEEARLMDLGCNGADYTCYNGEREMGLYGRCWIGVVLMMRGEGYTRD